MTWAITYLSSRCETGTVQELNRPPSTQLNRPSHTDVKGRYETDNQGKTIGDVFARRKTEKKNSVHKKNKRKQKWKQVIAALSAPANCFVELLGSICNCLPIGEVGNVRFQIDYLCGCSNEREGEDAAQSKNVFFWLKETSFLFGFDWFWWFFCFTWMIRERKKNKVPSLRHWPPSKTQENK